MKPLLQISLDPTKINDAGECGSFRIIEAVRDENEFSHDGVAKSSGKIQGI